MAFDRPLGSRYVVGPLLGRGSTGDVHRGRRSDGSDREVAVKVLRHGWTDDDDTLVRFLRERRTLASLKHPHIVEVLDLVVDDGKVGIVMELVPGGDLRGLLKTGRLPDDRVVILGHQIALALAAAHAARIVHGDVKPENVLVATTGRLVVKLGDFGVARLADGSAVRSSSRVGTPTYMAPEFVTGAEVGAPADVYALGVLLYEAVAGRPPFVGASPVALWRSHVEDEPVRPEGVSDAWWELLRRMLAKAAGDRPAAREVGAALVAGRSEPDRTALGASDGDRESTLLRAAPGPDGMFTPARAVPNTGSGPPHAAAPPPQDPDREPTLLRAASASAPAATRRPVRRVAVVTAAAALAIAGSVVWSTGLVSSPPGGTVMSPSSAVPTARGPGPQPTATPSTSGVPTPTAAASPAVTPPSASPSPEVSVRATTRSTGPNPSPPGPSREVPPPRGGSMAPVAPPAPASTVVRCQAASNSGGLNIDSTLSNSGGPNVVPAPCTSIYLTLTQVEYITYGRACLEDVKGTDLRCGSWVFLEDNGAWNRLLDGVSAGDRWQLYLRAQGPGYVGFEFSG